MSPTRVLRTRKRVSTASNQCRNYNNRKPEVHVVGISGLGALGTLAVYGRMVGTRVTAAPSPVARGILIRVLGRGRRLLICSAIARRNKSVLDHKPVFGITCNLGRIAGNAYLFY